MKEAIMFIDGTNLTKAYQKYEEWKVDMERLIVELPKALRLNLVQARYYTSTSDPLWYRERNSEAEFPHDFYFVRMLKRLGYEIRMPGYVKEGMSKDGPYLKEKGVDVGLALDALDFALDDEYDRAIIVSGDGDFIPLVRKFKDHSKGVTFSFYNNRASRYLKKLTDFFPLEKIKKEIELKPKKVDQLVTTESGQ
jgi:uncharacterized LabA/DUF88 family protein